MSKYNSATVGIDKTINYEGAEAYKLSAELELYSLVCTALIQPKFYETDVEQLNRLKKLVHECSVEFVAKLAIYAREKMYLRLIPLILIVELSNKKNGNGLISKALERVIQRADEITETLAYYQVSNNRNGIKKLNKLSNQIKKGLAKAFHKFTEYNFAKYNRDTIVKFRDALFLCHPKPRDEKETELFKKIANDTLETPKTWEVMLSEVGKIKFNNEEEKRAAFKAKWEEIIDMWITYDVGIDKNHIKVKNYMAILRNLRNILDNDISNEHINKVYEAIENKHAIINSKQLPFRFFAAYNELQGHASFNVQKIIEALEKAIKISIDNIPIIDGKIFIACDVSGSMETPLSNNSKISYCDVGILLGLLSTIKAPMNKLGVFGEAFAIKSLSGNNVLQHTIYLRGAGNEVGHSTNGYKAIDYLINNKIIVDKVFVFTDCQLWDSCQLWASKFFLSTDIGDAQNSFSKSWSTYKNEIAPKAKVYLFDLAGYGNTPISIKNADVYLISGWSDRIFEMLDAMQQGQGVINKINEIEL